MGRQEFEERPRYPQGDGGAQEAPRPGGMESLLRRSVPTIPREQLTGYTREGLQTRYVRDWNPFKAVEALQQAESRQALVIDLGSDKISSSIVTVKKGQIKPLATPVIEKKLNEGENYFSFLSRYSDTTLPVGISTAGLVDGLRLRESPNFTTFVNQLTNQHKGDFSGIYPGALTVEVGNDAVAGLIAATVEAAKRNPNVIKVIYLINGGGLGGGVWKDGKIEANEPGHLTVLPELNPYNQTELCKMTGAPNPNAVCLERIGASGVGVQEIYFQQTGQRLDGRAISNLYQQGDSLATNLYDNSARIMATAIVGLDQASAQKGDKALNPDSTIVLCHGGGFYVPGFGQRMEDILNAHLGYSPNVIYTKDFTQDTTGNACMDGAAILALTASPKPAHDPV